MVAATAAADTIRFENASLFITTSRTRETHATRMWADAQRDRPLPNIGGALCESSVIPFLSSTPQILVDARCSSVVQ